ncbi:MAG: hypothetical protein JSV81_02640, partial [Anaerolineales bacterium]
GVFWLSFADPAAIPAEIAASAERGGLELPPGVGDLPLDDQVRLVLSAWQSELPRLSIFARKCTTHMRPRCTTLKTA